MGHIFSLRVSDGFAARGFVVSQKTQKPEMCTLQAMVRCGMCGWRGDGSFRRAETSIARARMGASEHGTRVRWSGEDGTGEDGA